MLQALDCKDYTSTQKCEQILRQLKNQFANTASLNFLMFGKNSKSCVFILNTWKKKPTGRDLDSDLYVEFIRM